MLLKIQVAFAGLLMLAVASVASAMSMHDPRALSADPATAAEPIAPRLEGLGDHHMTVTTDNPESQYFFNQGIRLTYGFNHSEALRSFKEAARLDPSNAMAYWGWALVLGPNLNLPMMPYVAEQAYAALQEAVRRADGVSEREQALIAALAERYAPVAPENRRALDEAYAKAMAEVAARFPDDDDVATLHAAALMNLSPWNYWRGDGAPGGAGATETVLAQLEKVLARDPAHPGALHYHIHAVEAKHPARGESSADRLRGLMPGAGHMVHMPSHIYMRLGRYEEAFEANRLASLADESYISQCQAQGIYPLTYYPHNLHFMVWAAMFQGRYAEALAGARKVQEQVPKDENGKVEGVFETFMAQPLYVLVRFGRWDEVLAEPKPSSLNPFVTGVWHYARGVAYAQTGSRRKAQRELRVLDRHIAGLPEDYIIGFGTANTLLTIARSLLAGDVAMLRGRKAEAVAAYAKAVRLEDGLTYSEPPDWYFPTRHVLAWGLLEADLPKEAEAVLWQDLERNRDNAFAWKGLAAALAAQGQSGAAENASKAYEGAWGAADAPLTNSRF